MSKQAGKPLLKSGSCSRLSSEFLAGVPLSVKGSVVDVAFEELVLAVFELDCGAF